VVYWQQFEASEWDITYDAGKLASHGLSDWEAEEVIWNGFVGDRIKKSTARNATNSSGEQTEEGLCF
jgi:hypothetical protein